ncbi:cation diffusion facilitator family transporter [Crocinitomix algicola]|uniref:cation diffusion facilitator family transporter n=1 Tax=Crocinitomix algicola TaxID=1740263 RepID=UPI000871F97B|nr:cation diffusion facilitator family transporter [Crocinitomix algicola]
MGHHHEHHAVKNLRLAFFLNLAFTVFEIFGGIYTNSIAILSDAVHDLGDSLSLGTAWYLQKKSNRKSDAKFSFGYQRFSLLGALINSVVLVGGSIYVIYAAVERIMYPESSDAEGMIFFAVVGVLVNGYAAWKLTKGKTMNEKVIGWHLIEDVLGWAAILIVSIILYFKDIPYLDPILSLLITLYILYNAFKRLRETLYLFLQGNPTDINKQEIEKELVNLLGVQSIHQTAIWSLDGEHHVFSTHIRMNKNVTAQESYQIKKNINQILERYKFEYYTVETELSNEDCSMYKQ